MQFRNFAEMLLGSKVKIRILERILEDRIITSERELAKIIGVSHGAVNKAFKEFHELNFVTPLRVGNAIAWEVNTNSYAYESIKMLQFAPLDILKGELLAALEHPSVKKVVVYGSVAEGRELPNSDIDVFILVGYEENKKTIAPKIDEATHRILQLFGNKLSPTILTLRNIKLKKYEHLLEDVAKGTVVFEK